MYDLNEIKNKLSLEQIAEVLAEFGGDPVVHSDYITSRTICHEGDSHKLYYYDNTHLFRCYTGCEEPVFDIFQLVMKVKVRSNPSYQLPHAVSYIAHMFGFAETAYDDDEGWKSEDWNILKKYDRIKEISKETQKVELKEYDGNFLINLPRPIIMPWINDGISKEIMDKFEICYDPKNCGIVIPHRDPDGKLIGIRERIMSEEDVERYGKYLPMRLNGKMYNHPLSFSLYGLYQNKDNIKLAKRAFVFESEKSVLQYGSMFGDESNISVACCGSSFIQYQAWLLINLGVKEIIVGLDKQYKEFNDKEHIKLVKNLKQIHKKYGHYVKISYLFDKEDIIGYKDSPTDKGLDAFLELYRKRVNLY